MALTVSPYAHRINDSSPLGVTPSSPTAYPIMSRSVSINMDGMPDYGSSQEGLGMEMPTGLEGMVNYGGPSEEGRVPTGESPRSLALSHVLTRHSGPGMVHQPQHEPLYPPSSSHGPTVNAVEFQAETGMEGSDDEDDGESRSGAEADYRLSSPSAEAPSSDAGCAWRIHLP